MFHEVLEELSHSPFRVHIYPLGNIAPNVGPNERQQHPILVCSRPLEQLHGCSAVLEIWAWVELLLVAEEPMNIVDDSQV
jgi:hypothetical protein